MTRVLGSRLPPARAVGLLTAFAVSASLCTGLVLCLLAYVGTVALLPGMHPDDWSAEVIHAELLVPSWFAVPAGLLALMLLARAVVHVARVVAGARSAAADGPGIGSLRVVETDAVIAQAVPGFAGRRSRIVVSTGLLRRLTGPQRRALLAHEEAHLRHHHHVYVHLARLSAVAQPLLWPVARAVERAVERWADAESVRAVGDPVIVAHAIGVAALARPAGSLGAAGGDVVERVRDLLEPAAPRRRSGLGLVVASGVCWLSAAAVLLHTYGVVELSEPAR